MFILISIHYLDETTPYFPKLTLHLLSLIGCEGPYKCVNSRKIREIYWTICILNINEILNSYLKPTIKNQ